ncbi:MAG TPA: DUF2332 domain-containing protein [Marmoricola sp.]|nr:DUF2332 domain-containing protein [Marmoricola sp.]
MDLVEAFRTQADACASLGSPMYAELLGRLADDIGSGGAAAEVLRGHEDDPGPSGLALRLAGSLHRLVLAGAEPDLERFYPTRGGTWDLEAAWPVVEGVLRRRREVLRQLLDQPPQTNEVGRAAALLGGLLLLGERFGLPVRLFEIGGSGGLNLHADAFRYTDDRGRGWGPDDSPVQLDGAWSGEVPDLGAPVEVVERHGCDVAPVDVATEDGRLTLASYVWPDMADRHRRLRGALEVARRAPVPVRRQEAASFVEEIGLVEGRLTVLWHSVMWQYVPRDQQRRVRRHLDALGADAGPGRPLAHLYAEPVRPTPEADHQFWVCLEQWPDGGERELLGRVAPHGLPVRWEPRVSSGPPVDRG